MSASSATSGEFARHRPSALPALVAVALLMAGQARAADWPWGEEQDAVAAAPDSHRVLLENDHVRVLEVVIGPGQREPPHTHKWPSVMMVTEPARSRYYGAEGELVYETPPGRLQTPSEAGAEWLGPEGLHAVENIDVRRLRALRVELKRSSA